MDADVAACGVRYVYNISPIRLGGAVRRSRQAAEDAGD